ncbi:MAG: WXG100 family type VII secretion target [Actinobacteria bacterium]|nr:WXG100 family type VII secretion target [Actinomycetota bacterium]
MADRIAVDPEQLDVVAAKFQSEAETIRQIIATCRSRLDSLSAGWEGQAETKFLGEYAQTEASLNKVPELLTSVQTSLKNIATRFRAADSA